MVFKVMSKDHQYKVDVLDIVKYFYFLIKLEMKQFKESEADLDNCAIFLFRGHKKVYVKLFIGIL